MLPSSDAGGANMSAEKCLHTLFTITNLVAPPDLRSNKNDNGVDQSVYIISFDLPTSCDKISPGC